MDEEDRQWHDHYADMAQGIDPKELEIDTPIPQSICWGCEFCESGYGEYDRSERIQCSRYGFSQKLRKKHCKRFKQYVDDWNPY